MENTPQSYWLNYGVAPVVYNYRAYNRIVKRFQMFNAIDLKGKDVQWQNLQIDTFTGFFDCYNKQIFNGDILSVKFINSVNKKLIKECFFVIEYCIEKQEYVLANNEYIEAYSGDRAKYLSLNFVINYSTQVKIIGNCYTGVCFN